MARLSRCRWQFIICLCLSVVYSTVFAGSYNILGTNITLAYIVDDGKVTISDCNTDADGHVIIPSSISGMAVVGIKVNAFLGCRLIDSVTIPATVTSIGVAPFENCFELVSINVSVNNPSYSSEDGVLFDKNKELLIEFPHGRSGTYTIPSSVREIEYFAFSDSDLLTEVTFPPSLEIIGRYAFTSCDSLDNVQIPGTVDTIRQSAFASCGSLSELVLSHGIRIIESSAFSGVGITAVTVPGSVQSLGGGVFSGTALTSVTLISGVSEIPNSAFSSCRKLTQIFIPSTVTRIGAYAFRDCESLVTITLPEGIQVIDTGAFDSCDSLVTVEVPSTVNQLDVSSFGNCLSLQAINVSSSNAVYSSFNGVLFDKSRFNLIRCPKAKVGSYTIPSAVTKISEVAFAGCSGLTEIKIPYGVREINQGAFAGCSGLTEVNIPYGVTEINDSLFSGCEKLVSIALPNSVTRIGHWSFYGCTALETISIPQSVTDIYGASSFQGCTGIVSFNVDPLNANYSSLDGVLFNKTKTELIMCPASKSGDYTVPASVGDFDYYYSFRYCDKLQNIFVHPSNATYASVDGVVLNKALTELVQFPKGRSGEYTVPSSVLYLGIHSFSLSQGLERVELPSGLIGISREAFYFCRGLKEINIPVSVSWIGSQAFDGCSLLEAIFLGDAPSGYTNVSSSRSYYFEGASGFSRHYQMIGNLYSNWINNALNTGLLTLHEKLPTRDLDGDGSTNVIEYAFGGNPISYDSFETISASNGESDGTTSVRLKFLVREDATDITYVLKGSSNVSYWSRWLRPIVTLTPNGNGMGVTRTLGENSGYTLIGDGKITDTDDDGIYEIEEEIVITGKQAFFRIEIE